MSARPIETTSVHEATAKGLAESPVMASPSPEMEVSHHITKLEGLRSRLGLSREAPTHADHRHNITEHQMLLPRIKFLLREPLAEFFGAFVMILFGCGSVAQVLLSQGMKGAPGEDGWGPYQSINWGWGIGVMLGIYVAGDSGGFLNPGITFTFCFYRNLPWRRFPIYMFVQIMGCFCASGVVYANYITAIDNIEGVGIRTVPPSKTATAGIFCTYPQAFLGTVNQFFSEFIASAILMFCIFALKDESNQGAMGKSGAGHFFPLCLFFLIFGMGACWGFETGYAMNLARDFGPRLMSYALGYSSEVWSAGNYYFWVPMVAPFFGCMFGGFLYDLTIYTGPESPLNQPDFGWARYADAWRSWRGAKAERKSEQRESVKWTEPAKGAV